MEAERGAHFIRTHDTRKPTTWSVADALGDERTTRPETDSGPTVAELTDVTLREVARHQALGETVAGGTDDGATLTFLLGDVTDDARASLRAVAEVTDVVVVEKDGGISRRRLRGALKVSPTASPKTAPRVAANGGAVSPCDAYGVVVL